MAVQWNTLLRYHRGSQSTPFDFCWEIIYCWKNTQVFTVCSNCCNAYTTPSSPNCISGQIIDFSASFLNMQLFFHMLVLLTCLLNGHQRQWAPCRRHSWFKVLFLTFNLFRPMDHTLFCQFKCSLIEPQREIQLDLWSQMTESKSHHCCSMG